MGKVNTVCVEFKLDPCGAIPILSQLREINLPKVIQQGKIVGLVLGIRHSKGQRAA